MKNLRQTVIENCALLLKQQPETKGSLKKLVIEAFEKGVLIGSYAFAKGSKKQLSQLSGISYHTIISKIDQYKIVYLGTKPKDESYLALIKGAYRYTDSPLHQIELAVMEYAFFYCLSISPVKYLYEHILPEVEIPLIAFGFSEGGSATGCAEILGITRKTLQSRMQFHNIKSR
jgi:DNA-binding protein Fis